jgi:flagellar motor component MotA
MAKKDIPIVKKQIKELLKASSLEYAEMLSVLEPICEDLRKKSRSSVHEDVRKYVVKNRGKFLKAEDY